MSNHTPGPWQLLHGVLGVTVWAGDPAKPIIVSDRSNRDEDALANGRLIAAAPDMLAVLKAIFPTPEDGYHRLQFSSEAEREARAAIAKAEGKSS